MYEQIGLKYYTKLFTEYDAKAINDFLTLFTGVVHRIESYIHLSEEKTILITVSAQSSVLAAKAVLSYDAQ